MVEKKQYLYGASVQGIQSFIFKTNRLAEVVGASEMVEQICTEQYKEIIKVPEEDIIISAAGNLKLLLSEEDCEKMVLEFPKKIMEFAPGITISQAVVKMESNTNLSDAIDELEKKLRTQRSKVPQPFEKGYMATERDRYTNGVAVKYAKLKKGADPKAICEATKHKRSAAEKNFRLLEKIVAGNLIDKSQVSNQIEDLSIGTNSFVAVVHADGNGLGNLLQNMGKKLKEQKADNETIKNTFKNFSKALDTCTEAAAKEAFDAVYKADEIEFDKLPIRPIVLGGDDLTVIIQANMALPFVEAFLNQFEAKTKNLPENVDISSKGLTACAGIAYVKDKFPLHYAMDMAEQLCAEAKTKTNRKASGISFYKVQDSYVGSLSDMRKNIKLNDSVKYDAYDMERLTKLNTVVKALDSSSQNDVKGASKLRHWVTELTKDKNAAKFLFNRIKEINSEFYKKLKTNDEQIIYDALQIESLGK